jgi:hypothetical protein
MFSSLSSSSSLPPVAVPAIPADLDINAVASASQGAPHNPAMTWWRSYLNAHMRSILQLMQLKSYENRWQSPPTW